MGATFLRRKIRCMNRIHLRAIPRHTPFTSVFQAWCKDVQAWAAMKNTRYHTANLHNQKPALLNQGRNPCIVRRNQSANEIASRIDFVGIYDLHLSDLQPIDLVCDDSKTVAAVKNWCLRFLVPKRQHMVLNLPRSKARILKIFVLRVWWGAFCQRLLRCSTPQTIRNQGSESQDFI